MDEAKAVGRQSQDGSTVKIAMNLDATAPHRIQTAFEIVRIVRAAEPAQRSDFAGRVENAFDEC
jgi:hypothetical protein